jgi:3-phenylpropionate/trans-cinnamate dioxygenase ferredoxin reductase component
VTTQPSFIIVGGGLAGAIAAQTLREEGFHGRITLLGEEPHRPYERPPLSKDYLQGKADRDSIFAHPEAWYADHAVELRLGTAVTSLDPASRTVTTASGGRLGYDKLLLTTGSTPRRLTVPGTDLDGVHYLRSVDDSERIKAGFAQAHRVAIIGAGWIGLETAAARNAGPDVTLLEHAKLPLLRVLGPETAPIFADLHRDHGVDLHSQVAVAELTGRDGAVTGVILNDGSRIDADMVLVGVGITPNTQLATQAGLKIDNGVLVDEHLRTSAPPIRTSSPPATSPTPTTRAWAGTFVSSTGPTPDAKAPPPAKRCSDKTWSTHDPPTSSPTSTTSAWNTSATSAHPATTRSSSADTLTSASSSSSGSPSNASRPA